MSSKISMIKLPQYAVLLILTGIAACSSPEEKALEYLETGKSRFAEGDLVEARLEFRNVLQVQPKNAEARYFLARIGDREGEYQKAMRDLQIAIDIDPTFAPARVMLGEYYVLARRAKEAREHLDVLLEQDSENAEVRLLSARTLYLENRFEEALEEIDVVLAIDPRLRRAINFKALLQSAEGDIAAALETLGKGIEVAEEDDIELLRAARISLLMLGTSPEPLEAELKAMANDYPENTTYPIELAKFYLTQDRADEAEAYFRQLVANDPENTELRVQLANLLISLEDEDGAEASLVQAIEDNPDSLMLKRALAGFYESMENREAALSLYSEIAALEPKTAEGLAARNRIIALNIGIDDDKARSMIDELLTDAPDNVDALLARGKYSYDRGQYAAAVADARLALISDSDSRRALLLLARSHLGNGYKDSAESAYRAILATDPTDRVAINELAVMLSDSDDPAAAEDMFRANLQRTPGDVGASLALTKLLIQQQRYQEAEAESRRILELGELSGAAEFQLAEALRGQNRPEEAIDAYKASVAKNPDDINSVTRLTQLLVETGRVEEAQSLLAEHIAANPELVANRLLLGDLYLATGRRDEAYAVFSDTIDLDSTAVGAYIGLAGLNPIGSDERISMLRNGLISNPGDARLGLALGSEYKFRGEYEQAISVYESIFEQDASNDFIANNLANLLLDHRTDKASFAKALRIASRFAEPGSHPVSTGILGWAHYRNEDYRQAQQFLERAVAADKSPVLRYYLGMTYLKNGNAAGARQELESAIDAANEAGAAFMGIADAEQALRSLTGNE